MKPRKEFQKICGNSNSEGPTSDLILYDCIEGREIVIPRVGFVAACKELGIDYTVTYKLGKTFNSLSDRYILPERKDLIFTLIDVDSGKELPCIKLATLDIHLGQRLSDNERKYVFELKAGRQQYASIAGRVYSLKGGKTGRVKSKMKHQSTKLAEIIADRKLVMRLKNRLLRRMRYALRTGGISKWQRTEQYIGCSPQELYEYIQTRFTKNMGMHNIGEWHLDHIIPCEQYDLSDPQQQKLCFHYSNIQPLWATSETARKYGENDFYVGNLNKSGRGRCIDVRLLEDVVRAGVGFSIDEAAIFSEHLFKRGIRKFNDRDAAPGTAVKL